MIHLKKASDTFLGKFGFTIWLLPIGCLFFGVGFILGFYILLTKNSNSLEDIFYLSTVSITFLTIIIWFLYQAIAALNIIQEIDVEAKHLNIVFYFRKKIKINISNIDKISLLTKNNFLLKKHRAVQSDKPCLKIITKDNQCYIITPNMERFDELKLELEKFLS